MYENIVVNMFKIYLECTDDDKVVIEPKILNTSSKEGKNILTLLVPYGSSLHLTLFTSYEKYDIMFCRETNNR